MIYVGYQFNIWRKKNVFQFKWLLVKTITQELAILVFMIVMCVFAIVGDNGEVWGSALFDFLENMVFIAVLVAIAAEVFAILGNIYGKISKICCKKKNVQLFRKKELKALNEER